MLGIEFTPRQRWFTADLHFWHASMLSERFNFTERRARWNCVEEMNAAFVREWRDTVGPRDVIYHVGDLFHRCGKAKVLRILRDLSGHWIFLAPGNHDKKMLTKLHRQGELPENVKLLPAEPVMLDVCIDERPVFLYHYPPHLWPSLVSLPNDAILLHGHSHGRSGTPRCDQALDVGWDAHQRILSFDDLRRHFGGERGDTAL